jgi:hypothetical protein
MGWRMRAALLFSSHRRGEWHTFHHREAATMRRLLKRGLIEIWGRPGFQMFRANDKGLAIVENFYICEQLRLTCG